MFRGSVQGAADHNNHYIVSTTIIEKERLSMGLDMYVFKLKKVSQSDLEKVIACGENSYAKLRDINPHISCFTIDEDVEEAVEMFKDAMPYLTEVTLKTEYIDLDKVRDDYGVPDDADIVGRRFSGDGSVGITFRFGDERCDVNLTDDMIKEKYTKLIPEKCYIVERFECAYWRKAYNLQRDIYAAYDGVIQNCGYHKVNEDMYSLMADDINADFSDNEKEALFYHEWY